MQETKLEVGAIFEGKVTGITKFGAFVDIGGKTGMVHISEVAPVFVKEIRDFVTEGQAVKVKVIGINDDGKISLSMKKVDESAQQRPPRRMRRTPPRPEPRAPRSGTACAEPGRPATTNGAPARIPGRSRICCRASSRRATRRFPT